MRFDRLQAGRCANRQYICEFVKYIEVEIHCLMADKHMIASSCRPGRRLPFLIGGLALLALFPCSQVFSQEFDVELAKQATGVLNDYCKTCHGEDFNFPQLDVTSRDALLEPNGKGKKPFIVPGDPDASRIWARITAPDSVMPPDYMPQLSDEDKETVRKWITDGAHFPEVGRPRREYIGEKSVLDAIDNDLREMDQSDQQYVRYFSLYHLWNDTAGTSPLTDEDLRMARAAVSKLINSLSMKPRIAVPRIVDKGYGTLMAVDLRDYGWTTWHWDQLLSIYPYGLKATGSSSKIGRRVYESVGTKIPYIRADWFAYYASRPPLYHTLLNIPKNAKSLEARLGVNIYQNFVSNNLMRAAFDGKVSGVSRQNRMVERHEPTGGIRYFWKSYDIKSDTAALREGDFTRSPLGPSFEELEGRQQGVFDHDGGEIIFSLPNGLQAYMLVDGKDGRIDAGPLDVVQDPNQHSGTPEIVNGISCMGCHDDGMINWKDDFVRPVYIAQSGSALADKVLDLFPENKVFQDIVDDDRKYFMAKLKEATAPFLLEGQMERDADELAKFFGDLLQASEVQFDSAKLQEFMTESMKMSGMDSMDRKQAVMQLVAKGNDQFDWGLSIDDSIAMYEIKPIRNATTFDTYADPVTKLAKIYYRDVGIEDVVRELGLPEEEADAKELGLKTISELRFMTGLKQFQNLGMASLSQENGTITRPAWERAFGRVARETGCGIPVTRIIVGND